MYFSDRITLISETVVPDAIGNRIATRTETEVWADLRSVSRAEFSAAGVMGLKPAAVVVVHACDYSGQTLIRVNEILLAVYRSYCSGETVELYAEEKRGV